MSDHGEQMNDGPLSVVITLITLFAGVFAAYMAGLI